MENDSVPNEPFESRTSSQQPGFSLPTSDQSSIPQSAQPEKDATNGDSPLRIATRESPLAMWQARHVAEILNGCGVQTSLVPLVSSGDVDMRPIDGTRSVGVFTKRIQQALLDDEGDVAVHSMKDLPTEQHDALALAASPKRETVLDCLVSTNAIQLNELPEGARVGTGSRRRAAQLLRQRPDLDIRPIRGNVQTRLRKLEEGEYDAIVLAAAGLERLKIDVPRVTLALDLMLPAPGQGALAIEIRREDSAVAQAVSLVDHAPTSCCVTAERRLLSELHGGCLAPIAAHATAENGKLVLRARVLSCDGSQCLEHSATIEMGESENQVDVASELGRRVAGELIGQGARELISEAR